MQKSILEQTQQKNDELTPIHVSKGLYFYHLKPQNLSKTIVVVFRSLSYKELLSIQSLEQTKRFAEAKFRTCELAVVKIDSDNSQLTLDDLGISDIELLADKIMSVSIMSDEIIEKLDTSIKIHFNKKFQSDTWKCSVCREKHLDKIRNCGFRNEKNKNPDFKIEVAGQLYTYCPIYDLDRELLSNAIECFNIYDAGFLPDDGGFYDQTHFFITASKMVLQEIKKQEQKELEKMTKNYK